MHLTRLALTDFRCYEAAELTLEAGVTTLLGANGQGKTNLVEAAGYLATLGSHRVAGDAPLVRRGAARAILRAEVTSAAHDSLLEIEINPGRANRARLNRSPVSRPRQLLGVLTTVMFAPEDLALVKGEPDQRRRYLDDLLVASAPRYAAVRADYDRALRQRTALLKSLRARPGHRPHQGAPGPRRPAGTAPGGGPAALPDGPARALDVWDEHLARAGAELLAGRLRLTAALSPLVSGAYAAVSGAGTPATIGYRRSPGPSGAGPGQEDGEPDMDPAQLADWLREALARARPEELDRGVCLVGPHRDELELGIAGLPARGYASHGESWSLALALRLSSYDLLRGQGEDPVLLLDDVFAELDAGRRDRLAAVVAGAEQVLVTAAVAADVPAALAGPRFEVAGGAVSRAG